MSILLVDHSEMSRHFIVDILETAGYQDLICCGSAEDAFEQICALDWHEGCPEVDLVLMDIHLPGMDGIQACRDLKALTNFREVPVIIISGTEHFEGLELAFAAGAMDYITKPPHRIELLARVRSALRLKEETDHRRAREAELLVLNERLAEMNLELERLAVTDSLTGLANRRSFNTFLADEWRRAIRQDNYFAVLMVDIDHFKAYNDNYGHLAGDVCLQKIAMSLQAVVHRTGDLVARYGGEEFVIVLPDTNVEGALLLAQAVHGQIAELALSHQASPVHRQVTVSVGVAVEKASAAVTAAQLVAKADAALYRAKETGRNRTVLAED
jgi:diguanylate cyclase (GGDEF)-like protein